MLSGLVNFVLWILVIAVAAPVFVLVIQTVAAILPRRLQPQGDERLSGKLAVVIPAHNEEGQIARTVTEIRAQLRPADRILVVADNCTDQTASFARAAGADVIERNDVERRGKGYALACGIDLLRQNPPGMVIILDADCIMSPGSVQLLTHRVLQTGLPAQARYTLVPDEDASCALQISAFAFAFKNVVRAIGREHLGWPSPLMGTGMALPWEQIHRLELANGNLVEDLQMGLDLVLAGQPPTFVADAKVVSPAMSNQDATYAQRRRWEHGHLKTIGTQVPRLLRAGLSELKWRPMAAALDLSVPPLSLLVTFWMAVEIAAAIGSLAGKSIYPAIVNALAGIALGASILASWPKFGRQILPLRSLVAIPGYVAWKLPLYLAMLTRCQNVWVRSHRPSLSARDLR